MQRTKFFLSISKSQWVMPKQKLQSIDLRVRLGHPMGCLACTGFRKISNYWSAFQIQEISHKLQGSSGSGETGRYDNADWHFTWRWWAGPLRLGQCSLSSTVCWLPGPVHSFISPAGFLKAWNVLLSLSWRKWLKRHNDYYFILPNLEI